MQEKTKKWLKRAFLGSVLSASLFNLISCASSNHFVDMDLTAPQITQKGNASDKTPVPVYTSKGVFDLDKLPGIQTLNKQQRSDKLYHLKQNVQGFSRDETQKIKRCLDTLFSLPDTCVQEVLDGLSKDVMVRPMLKMDGPNLGSNKCSAFYNAETNSVVLFGESLRKNDLEVICMIAHELDHARKKEQGITNGQLPNLIDNERFVSFSLLDEASSAAFEEHVKMRVATKLQQENRLDGNMINFLNKTERQAQYQKMYNRSVHELQGEANQTAPEIESQASARAQGQFIKGLLSGSDSKWTEVYINKAVDDLAITYREGGRLAAQPNADLTHYVYSRMAQKYGLSLRDLEKPVELYLSYDNGKASRLFEKFETNSAGMSSVSGANKEFKTYQKSVQSTLKAQLNKHTQKQIPYVRKGHSK